MLIKYVSLTTATQAQILADLVALAVGGSIASLSASCDKVATTVLANTDASGWSLLDAAGPSSGKVLTAKDAANNDKFVSLYPQTTTNIVAIGYDTYNTATHTGTNATTTTNAPIVYTANIVNTYYVYATMRHLLIINSLGTIAIGSVEFNRDAPFLSNGVYPAHSIIGYWGYGVGFSTIRVKHPTAVGDQLSNQNAAALSSIAGIVLPTLYRDASDSVVYPTFDAYLVTNNLPLGKIPDMLLGCGNMGSPFDTVDIDLSTYFILTWGASLKILLKFG